MLKNIFIWIILSFRINFQKEENQYGWIRENPLLDVDSLLLITIMEHDKNQHIFG